MQYYYRSPHVSIYGMDNGITHPHVRDHAGSKISKNSLTAQGCCGIFIRRDGFGSFFCAVN